MVLLKIMLFINMSFLIDSFEPGIMSPISSHNGAVYSHVINKTEKES